MIAALYVIKDGPYYLEGADPWPEDRDARLYAGPWPVRCLPAHFKDRNQKHIKKIKYVRLKIILKIVTYYF